MLDFTISTLKKICFSQNTDLDLCSISHAWSATSLLFVFFFFFKKKRKKKKENREQNNNNKNRIETQKKKKRNRKRKKYIDRKLSLWKDKLYTSLTGCHFKEWASQMPWREQTITINTSEQIAWAAFRNFTVCISSFLADV